MTQTAFMNIQVSRLLLALVCATLVACSSNPAIEESHRLNVAGKPEEALETLYRAARTNPEDREVRTAYFRARELLVGPTLTAAEKAKVNGRLDEAETHARLVLRFDSDNPRARSLLVETENARKRTARLSEAENLFAKKDIGSAERIVRAILAEYSDDPGARTLLRKIDDLAESKSVIDVTAVKSPFSKPVTLEFREAPLRNVFEAISRTSGINFILDKDVRPDTKITVFVRNTSIDEVIRLVLTTNQLDRKLLNENSVLIYPSNAAKQRDYQELVTRSFFLGNTEAKQAQALIKQVVKTKDIFIDESLNLIIIKDTPEAVRLAERLIQTLDVAGPEVMLDVEVLEINRNKLMELGVKFPDQIGYGLLQPTTNNVVTTAVGTTQSTNLGGQLLQGNINLRGTGAMVPYVSNPGLLLNLKDQGGNSNILANPRIRVKNREKAKILIGDKLPVFTTTSTANVGVSASVNYLDVGLKLEVQPVIHLDNDVDINVMLEVSSIVKEVNGPQGALAYQIGTRNANTILRLKDGETQVLAGLISDEERTTASHLPGLGRIPFLGRLFSNQHDSANKTEIVLLITPRVLRNLTPPAVATAAMPAGTEASVGADPLVISASTAPRSMDIRGASSTGTAPVMSLSQVVSPRSDFNPQTPVANNGQLQPTPTSPARTETAAQFTTSIFAPPQVAAGQEFSVIVSVRGTEPILSGEVSVSFDARLFTIVGDQSAGTLILAPAGTTSSAQLRLKAQDGAYGDGSILVTGGQIRTAAGATAIQGPAPSRVKVGQIQ